MEIKEAAFLQAYLANPCRVLSIPFWKARNMELPSGLHVVHEQDFCRESHRYGTDEPYFRLSHRMEGVGKPDLVGFSVHTATQADWPAMVSIIARSYEDMQMDLDRLADYAASPVYHPALWILVRDGNRDEWAGCGIAELDRQIGELALEWIQVLPEYRRRGVGQLIVRELLYRMVGTARFATVSGRVDSESHPEALYRKCGFEGQDIWHVLRES